MKYHQFAAILLITFLGTSSAGCSTSKWIGCAGQIATCAPQCTSISTSCITCMGGAASGCLQCVTGSNADVFYTAAVFDEGDSAGDGPYIHLSSLNPEEATALRVYDSNGDGKLSYVEFNNFHATHNAAVEAAEAAKAANSAVTMMAQPSNCFMVC